MILTIASAEVGYAQRWGSEGSVTSLDRTLFRNRALKTHEGAAAGAHEGASNLAPHEGLCQAEPPAERSCLARNGPLPP